MSENQDAFSDLLPVKVPSPLSDMQNPESPFADDAVLANMPVRDESQSSGVQKPWGVVPTSGSPMVRKSEPVSNLATTSALKKMSESLHHMLDEILRRIEALENRTEAIQQLVGDIQEVSAVREEAARERATAAEKSVREMQRTLQILRDKAELAEATAELAKISSLHNATEADFVKSSKRDHNEVKEDLKTKDETPSHHQALNKIDSKGDEQLGSGNVEAERATSGAPMGLPQRVQSPPGIYGGPPAPPSAPLPPPPSPQYNAVSSYVPQAQALHQPHHPPTSQPPYGHYQGGGGGGGGGASQASPPLPPPPPPLPPPPPPPSQAYTSGSLQRRPSGFSPQTAGYQPGSFHASYGSYPSVQHSSAPLPPETYMKRTSSHPVNGPVNQGQQDRGQGQQTAVPLEKVIDDVAVMGFSREHVRSVLQELMAQGKSIDLNLVLDRLGAR